MKTLKGKEILQYGTTWVNPEDIMLRKPDTKDKFCDSTDMRYLVKFIDTVAKS